MGSSSSKPRYDYDGGYGSSAQYPVQDGSYPVYGSKGQLALNSPFDYYMKQGDHDPSRVQTIPGYYYPVESNQGRQTSRRYKRAGVPFIPPDPDREAPTSVRPAHDTQAAPGRKNTPQALTTEPSPTTDTPNNNEANAPGALMAEAASSGTVPEPDKSSENAAQPEAATASASAPPKAGAAETAALPEKVPEDRPRRANPLPPPPRNVLAEKYPNLLRATGAPNRSATTQSDRQQIYYKPKASTLKPPAPHEEILARSARHRRAATISGPPTSAAYNNIPRSGSSRKGPTDVKKTSPAATQKSRGPRTTEWEGLFKALKSFTFPFLSGKGKGKNPMRRPVPSSVPISQPMRPTPRAVRRRMTEPAPAYAPRRPIYAEDPAAYMPYQRPVYVGPPITVPLNSNLNPTSPHKILYKKKLYPTAAHLWDAHKFLKHHPELAERIRTTYTTADMVRLSWEFQLQGYVRDDWELVWRDKLDEVLYLKFIQHPELRSELMATGYVLLLDGHEMTYRDMSQVHDPSVNELGKALVRLRERLRREGAR